MIYCRYCGKANPEESRFCAACGKTIYSSPTKSKANSSPKKDPSSEGSLLDHLNGYMGNSKPAELNWKSLFADVFEKHTVDEAEEIFICGTKKTTPKPSEVSTEWPHPWLYSRIFAMFFIASFLLWICCTAFGNFLAYPGMMVVASLTVPLSTMILFMEVNAWRDISFYKMMQVFFIGGCASLVATLFLFTITGGGSFDLVGAFIIGVTEETGKMLIVYYFLKQLNKQTILGGLLIGSCVGAGFAAFESAGYAMQVLMSHENFDAMLNNIVLRGFLAPGGHVTWAAISGAALVIAAKAQGKMSVSVFTNSRFLRLYLLPIAMHTAWDWEYFASIGAEIHIAHISLIIFVWVVIMILINMGLAEVSGKTKQ